MKTRTKPNVEPVGRARFGELGGSDDTNEWVVSEADCRELDHTFKEIRNLLQMVGHRIIGDGDNIEPGLIMKAVHNRLDVMERNFWKTAQPLSENGTRRSSDSPPAGLKRREIAEKVGTTVATVKGVLANRHHTGPGSGGGSKQNR